MIRGAVVLAASVLAVGLCLSGCTGSGDPEDVGTPGGGGTLESSETAASPDLAEAPDLRRGGTGAVADVELDTCPTEPGTHEVTGEVTNSASRPRDYVVTVNWTDDASSVTGRGVAVVQGLGPGESAMWTMTAEAGAGTTRCFPNVRAGRLAE